MGIDRPNGGGNFVFGFNSLDNAEGAVGLHCAQVNFNPIASGVSVRAAIKRGASGGPTSFAPFLFVGLQGTAIGSNGYLFGLSDDDPTNLLLRKGSPLDGLPPNAPGDPATLGTLLRSTEQFAQDTWQHVRLDMIVNGTGDVVLQCFESDLEDNPVTAPIWTAIPGMEEFIDDALGVNSGSLPFTSGRAGMAFWSAGSTRRGFFDQVEVLRQL